MPRPPAPNPTTITSSTTKGFASAIAGLAVVRLLGSSRPCCRSHFPFTDTLDAAPSGGSLARVFKDTIGYSDGCDMCLFLVMGEYTDRYSKFECMQDEIHHLKLKIPVVIRSLTLVSSVVDSHYETFQNPYARVVWSNRLRQSHRCV